MRAHPPAPREAGGEVLGIETVIGEGEELSWKGPFGREGRVSGVEGRFEVWRDPYWAGSPEVKGRYVVDHPLGWLEAGHAVLGFLSVQLGFVLLVGVLAVFGGIGEWTVLALALRLLALQPAFFMDSAAAAYQAAAVQMGQGGLELGAWPPGWPGLLALVQLIFGTDPMVGRVLGAVLGALLVPLLARVAPTGSAQRATALLIALSSELIQFSPTLFSEPLFLVLSAIGLGASAGWGGLTFAFASLTRSHLVGIVPFLRKPSFRYWLGFLLPILLWVGWRGELRGELGENLWIGHRPGADGWWSPMREEPPEGFFNAAVQAILTDPWTALELTAKNVVHLWGTGRSDRTMATHPLTLPQVAFSVLFPLAFLALRRWRPKPLLIWLALTTLITAVFFVTVRFKLGLYPALLPLAGVGLVELWTLLKSAVPRFPRIGVPVLVYAIAAIFLLGQHQFPMAREETDSIGYLLRAEGPWFSLDAFHGPGYPWMLKPLLWLGEDPYRTGQFLSVFSGAVLLLSSMLLFRRLRGETEAIVGGLILSLHPTLLSYSVCTLSDMAAAGWIWMALALMVLRPSRGAIFLGFCVGMAYLCRYVGGVVLLVALWSEWRATQGAERWKNLGILLIGALLPTLPWLFYLTTETGSPFWSHHHLNLAFAAYFGNSDWNLFPELSQYPTLLSVLLADPLQFFAHWLQTLATLPRALLEPMPLLGLFLVPGLLFWKADQKLWGFVLPYAASMGLLWVEPRFLLPLLPWVTALLVRGVWATGEVFSGKIAKVVLLLLLGSYLHRSFLRVQRFLGAEPKEYAAAAAWLKETNSGRLLCAKPQIAYFANREWTGFRELQFQNRSWEELPEVLEAGDYLVWDDRYAAEEFPMFERLSEGNRLEVGPYQLEPVFSVGFPKNLWIYQIFLKGREDR